MTKIITVLLLAVAVAGGGFYFFVVRQPTISSNITDTSFEQTNNNQSSTGTLSSQPSASSQSGVDSSVGTYNNPKSKTILDLIKEGKNQKCTVKAGFSNLQTMFVYVSDGKARTEYISPSGDKGTISAIANDDKMEVYLWTLTPGEAEPLGFINTFNSRANYEKFMTADPYDSYGMAEEVGDAKCESWTPDPSVFTLPNVHFFPSNKL